MSYWKAVLYVLLTTDAVYFALAGTHSKAIDAAAWLLLLGLYEVGLSSRAARMRPTQRAVLSAARVAAGAGVIAATAGYVFENNVLDALNSALWIAVVILLEIEVRSPRTVEHAR